MPGKDTIAGYECSSFEMNVTDGKCIYYFITSIAVNKASYAKHNFSEWNTVLNATNGALPMKMTYTNNKAGYIWTSTVAEVTKADLTQKDFELPPGAVMK